MYTYYKEVKTKEKMLSAGEIANLFKLETIDGIPATKLVNAVLKKYIENLSDYEQTYYINSHGYKNEVYSMNIYTKAVAILLSKILNKFPNANLYSCSEHIFEITIDDKKYKFKIM